MRESASGKADSGKYATPKSGSDTPQLESEKWLRHEYHTLGRTLRDIASELDCATNTIGYWMDKHGIDRRRSGKERADKRLYDKEWYYKKYWIEGYSTTEIADICDCAPETSREWKRKHGILSRTDYKSRGSGSDNPNWRGGHREYGPNWYEQREKALDRDNYTCQGCGVEETKLHVHHIRPRADFIKDGELDHKQANRLSNLVVLCGECHNRWEGIYLRPKIR